MQERQSGDLLPMLEQDRIPSEKRERQGSVAVGVFIVALDSQRNGDNAFDPLIWTIVERLDKKLTSRIAGQISFPAETRKNGEAKEENVLGALAEFCNDEAFSYVTRHLIQMDDASYREKGLIVGGDPADVAVLIYDGAIDFPFKPTCNDEVSPNGWVRKSELVADTRIRDAFRQALELDDREGLIASALESYYANPDRRKPVFTEDITSIQAFFAQRETGQSDITELCQGWRDTSLKLPDAHEAMSEAFRFLASSQRSGWGRSLAQEDEVVAQLEHALRDMENPGGIDYLIGLDRIKAFDMSVIADGNRPIGGFKSWGPWDGEFRREQREKAETHREKYRLEPLKETAVKPHGRFEIERGDRLGYPDELGTNWYLSFSIGREGDASSRYAIVPIEQIVEMTLQVVIDVGM